MSTAVIQGSSSGLGLALTRHILHKTDLKVYALTHRSAREVKDRIVEDRDFKDRLTVVDGIDVREEEGLENAARLVKDREGKDVRLLVCLAGILHPEKSLAAIDPVSALDTFKINTLGHLSTYKHFVPLIPSLRELAKLEHGTNDPARGLVGGKNSLCFSLSARVGSIGDNNRGGWYSYRASKAALNQIVRCLDHELLNKSSSALAMAYHPGTVLTDFTSPIIGNPSPDPSKGLLTVEDAIQHMTTVMSKATRDGEWGGRCFDWKGEKIEW